nr:DUF6879 family protein [Nocardia nova]
MTRVRIVSVPHTDYTRFSMRVAELNTDAGEDIRYLSRHDAGEVPPDDFWLFDDETVIYSAFGESGGWSGALTTDPHIVEYALGLKQRFWSRGTPFWEYVSK